MDSRQRDRSLCGFRPGAFLATITIGIVLAGTLQTTAARGQGLAGVAALQVGLRAHGFYAGPVDGLFGPQTAKAIRTLQRRRGLLVDGVPGPRTRAALGRYGRPRLGSRLLREACSAGTSRWSSSCSRAAVQIRGPSMPPSGGRRPAPCGATSSGRERPRTAWLGRRHFVCSRSAAGAARRPAAVSQPVSRSRERSSGVCPPPGQTMLCARHSPIHCGWPFEVASSSSSRTRSHGPMSETRSSTRSRRGRAALRPRACATSPSQGVGGMAGASGVSTTGQLTFDRIRRPAAAAESPAVGVSLVSRGSCKSVRQAPRESGPVGHPRPHPSCSAERYFLARTFGPIIVVRRKAHRLSLYDGTRLIHTFRVGTGKRGFPTPLGRFSIVSKARNRGGFRPSRAGRRTSNRFPLGPATHWARAGWACRPRASASTARPTPRRSDIPGRTAAYGCTSRMPSGFSSACTSARRL